MTLHRNDPAVKDFSGVSLLAAKVVDEVNAIVGLQLKRRVVYLGMGIIGEVEHFERKFAAGDDKGTPAFKPAGIVRQIRRERGNLGLLVVDLLVINRVVQLN